MKKLNLFYTESEDLAPSWYTQHKYLLMYRTIRTLSTITIVIKLVSWEAKLYDLKFKSIMFKGFKLGGCSLSSSKLIPTGGEGVSNFTWFSQL